MRNASKVLIVDDEVIYTDILASLLSKNGYEYETASNGTEALRKIRGLQPDLVILDVMMPGMDGYETCDALRKDPSTNEIPVIMVTMLGDNESKLRGLKVGANDFLHKPVDAVELMIKANNLVKLKRYQDTLRHNITMLETEVIRRKQTEAEREKLIEELTNALAKIKTLTGLLPICSSCKKIRDDKGYWEQVEVYVGEHTHAEFTHSLCPTCAEKLYPEYYAKVYGRNA